LKIVTQYRHFNGRNRSRWIFLFWLFLLWLPGTTQSLWLDGKVLDESGQPFFGATIVLNTGQAATISNHQGDFSLPVPGDPFVLTASALGYRSVRLTLKADTLSGPLAIRFVPDPTELETIEINWNRLGERRPFPGQVIEHIHRDDLLDHTAGNLVKTLSRLPGIQSVSAGTGFSRPMIRGMGFYRLVFAENGIKQAGQNWSNHHGISVDQHSVHTVEVIRGPACLEYGTDAIGGVINLLPHPVSPGWDGRLAMTARSNTRWLGGSGELGYGGRRSFFQISGSRHQYGDFRIPETASYLLPAPVQTEEASHQVALGKQVYNTAGEETAVHLTGGLLRPWGKAWLEINYHTQYAGFFDWQGLQLDSLRQEHEASSFDVRLPAQKIDNLSIRHFTNYYIGANKLEVALGFQSNRTREYSPLSDLTGNRQAEWVHYMNKNNLALDLTLHSWIAKVIYSVQGPGHLDVRMGLNVSNQFHQVDGYSHILPRYSQSMFGGFIQIQKAWTELWKLNAGMRYDHHGFNMDASENPDPAYGDESFNPELSRQFPGYSFSAGLVYQPGNGTAMRLNLGKSYRIPSAYELGAYGLHRHEGRFEQGDVNNEPEEAWQIDLSLEHGPDDRKLRISPFLNYFTNYLFLRPTPYLRPEGQVYAYDQTRALMTGTEISFLWNPYDRIELQANLEYVYAVNLDLESALPFTPPLKSVISVRYSWGKIQPAHYAGFNFTGVAPQRFTVPNELDTPGYFLVGLNAGSLLKINSQSVNIRLQINNLFNTSYFDHLSFYRRLRIPEAGRDVHIYVEIPFFKTNKQKLP
jgi:iron complex outermembrane receptor protein